jgi:hypothetical protein
MKRIVLTLFTLSLVLVAFSLSAWAGPFDVAKGESTLALAKGGAALQPIVISPNASEDTKAVAAELAGYLKRITGATFEVKAGDGTSGIVLGNISEFPNPSLNKPLEIRDTYNGREAFSIRTQPRRVLLIGATDLGVSYSAFRFLELIGYRHFFPNKAWEVVPNTPDLQVSLQEDKRPDMLDRRIWFGFGTYSKEAAYDYQDWVRHNGMGAGKMLETSLPVKIGHAWTAIARKKNAELKLHPEYIALVNGKRVSNQFCVSNAGLRKMVTDYALEYLRENPTETMVSIGPADGGGFCECENCAKLGTVSDQVYGLANEVARAVQKEFPGKMVALYAYSYHSEPPAFKLEPNVYIELTVGYNYGPYTFDELVDLWSKKATHMGFREYYSVYAWDYDEPARARASDIGYIRKYIPYFIDKGGDSLNAESGANWGPNGRGYYLANYLMWDGKADVDALLDDFYAKLFGPAAEAMHSFYDRFDKGRSPLISEHWIGLALRDLQQAAELTKDRPDIQARLDHLKQYMHFVKLRWEYNYTPRDEANRERLKAVAIRMMTQAYRTRGSYMDHWNAIRRAGSVRVSWAVKEPTWSYKDNSPKPWTDDTPVTPAETGRNFQEDLEYFKPVDLEEKTFSNDLVPVKFTDKAPAAVTMNIANGMFPYAFYSEHGEPIELNLTLGTKQQMDLRQAQATNADTEDDGDEVTPPVARDARYSLTTPDGKVVRQGVLPIDFQPQKLQFKVPAQGLYYFNLRNNVDGGALYGGWKMDIPEGETSALVLPQDFSFNYQSRIRDKFMYFYVPKGTAKIQYYYNKSLHSVYNPLGNNVRTLDSAERGNGHVVEIPVPKGMDGKLWAMKYFVRNPIFYNIPNVMSTSPDVVLIPREVAQKDGLTVVD